MLRPIYSLYNRRLQEKLAKGELPRHVGVILDGNRRFAQERRFEDVSQGHRAGAQKIDELLEWCAELRIPIVTMWLLSTDNFRRDAVEVSTLLSIIEAKIVQLTYAPTTYERRYRIRVLGRRDVLPVSFRTAIQEVEERTRHHDGAIVNLAIGYGGREEIIDAVGHVIRTRSNSGEPIDSIVSAITPADVDRHFYAATLPDPDLIIRTSGEVRLSGFLLWQSAHSEFYFCDANWPDFRKVDFLRALRSYQSRKQRYGAVAQPDDIIDIPNTPASPQDSIRFAQPRLHTTRLPVLPTSAPEFIDITERVQDIVQKAGISAGEVRLYIRHTTAGLTINEHEPLLLEDMQRYVNRLAPPDDAYAHNDFAVRTVNMTEDESPNGHSHCARIMFNTSEFVPILDGRMQLGTWQRIFFVELDGAREREVLVQVFGE